MADWLDTDTGRDFIDRVWSPLVVVVLVLCPIVFGAWLFM